MKPLLPTTRRDAAVDVVGLGETSLDYVLELERFPSPGEKVRLVDAHELPGGQVATTVLACTRLGLRAALVTRVGDDDAGERALAPLGAAGVDLTDAVAVRGAATRRAVILVERTGGERTVLWHRDPALALEAGAVDAARVARGRALHLDTTDPDASLAAARAARAAGVPVFLDADTAVPGLRRLLAAADFPILSQGLARELGGSDAEGDALRVLAELGARFPVVTLGERGALAGVPGAAFHVPAFDVHERDTTGAGDVFHAAFLAAALDGATGAEAVRFANAAAAWNCRGLGAQGALPSRGDVVELLRTGKPRSAPAG